MATPIQLDEQEWRRLLTDEQYRVARQKGTEPAFANAYWNNHEHGIYECVCCGMDLFRSETKFESGTGWPSFYAPLNDDRVATQVDASHGMQRVEVHCQRCGAHLGHQFPDGPKPSGLRYCMNSAALNFVATPSPEQSPNENADR